MTAPQPCPPPGISQVLSNVLEIDNADVITLFHQIKAINRILHRLFEEHQNEDSWISHARMRVLIRLEADARQGQTQGILPSELSDWLGVSRNTVSSLLNGLEEQNLIVRELHRVDRRQILISITGQGRALVQERAPKIGAFITELFAVLNSDEQNQLAALLEKLLGGMVHYAQDLHMATRDDVSPSE